MSEKKQGKEKMTPYHSQYYAHELTKRCSSEKIEKLPQSLFNATVDMNPHPRAAPSFPAPFALVRSTTPRSEYRRMNQFSGLLVTALSVMVAAIVSGVRLKPYLDAGAARTPPSFMLYPVLIAIAITVPIVFLLRKLQGKKNIDIGPVTFNDRMPFIALGCIVYAVIAMTFFYDRTPALSPLLFPPSQNQPGQPEEPDQPEAIKISFPAAR